MSTQSEAPYISAHVPVDRFEIVNGPGVKRCTEIRQLLHLNDSVEATFTLKTAASTASFKREIKLKNVYSIRNGQFDFTAIFNGRIVSGQYDTKTRTGWFNLD